MEQDTSIRKDLDACTCLVEVQCAETDSKFHRKHSNTSLLPLVSVVELVNRSPSIIEVTFLSKLFEKLRNVPVNINLLEKRGIISLLVQVFYSEIIDGYTKPFSNGGHVAFGNEHGLWTAEASECCIAVGIRLADMAAYINIGYFIAASQ